MMNDDFFRLSVWDVISSPQFSSSFFMTSALVIYTLFGHAFFWIGVANRLNSISIPRRILKSVSKLVFAIISAGPIALLLRSQAGFGNPFCITEASSTNRLGSTFFAFYVALCWLAGASTIVRWLWLNLYFYLPPKISRSHDRRRADISVEQSAINPEERTNHFSASLPGNQSLLLEVTRWEIDMPRLPPTLDGLKILHLSDIHFTGKIGKAYFREVVRVCNELQPDLIALTGDYADANSCIDWIPDTLGQLSARYGVYYVMGNHDIYIDTHRLREVMNLSGLIDLGSRCKPVLIRGESVILAGNELPWIAPAADLSRLGTSSAQGGPVRIVLAHAPDQIEWARSNGADLMLCGHTHGGQLRFPIVGAIFMPSYYGVKFDCGLYHLPPTILHVTRGVSGKHPLRWNCMPEISLLTLHSPLV
jgi:uncharacterized protein